MSFVALAIGVPACGAHERGAAASTSVSIERLERQFRALGGVWRSTAPPVCHDSAASTRCVLQHPARPISNRSRSLSLSTPFSTEMDGSGAISLKLQDGPSVTMLRIGDSSSGVGGKRLCPRAIGVSLENDRGEIDAFSFLTDTGVEDVLIAHDPSPVGYQLSLPDHWVVVPAPMVPSLLEVRDENGVARLRIRTGKSWDNHGREVRAVPRVLGASVTWSVEGDVAWPVMIDPSIEVAGTLLTPRAGHTATLLPSGKILLAGGDGGSLGGAGTTELIDPAAGTFTSSAKVNSSLVAHTATLLRTGHVLLAGGSTGAVTLYDSVTETARDLDPMAHPREHHTATVLPSGQVLFVGGDNGVSSVVAEAELFDPVSGTFSSTGGLKTARTRHTATLLSSGKVLIAGGTENQEFPSHLTSSEVYDPATGKFEQVGPMSFGRYSHAATLLPSGKVLIVGGEQALGSENERRAELFDPETKMFSPTAEMHASRAAPTATLLPSGNVLVFGADASSELFDPISGTFVDSGTTTFSRIHHTATLLPSGKVLVTGGTDLGLASSGGGSGFDGSAAVEVFDEQPQGTRVSGATLEQPRADLAMESLPDGKVLIAGGVSGYGFARTAVDMFDPATDTITAAGDMIEARQSFSATQVRFGKVLFVGGGDVGSSPAEVYDPSTGAFSIASGVLVNRSNHTGTLLDSGKVLLAGGFQAPDAELYDPELDQSEAIPSMSPRVYGHTAVRLLSGKVLLTGGYDTSGAPTASAQVYNPSTNTFESIEPLGWPRAGHTMTRLDSGQVVVTGGGSGTLGIPVNTVELFDPDTQHFVPLVSMGRARRGHTATLLSSGQVLIAGGYRDNTGYDWVAEAELLDPLANTIMEAGTMKRPRGRHAALRIAEGNVLFAGGTTLLGNPADPNDHTDGSIELFDYANKKFAWPGGVIERTEQFSSTLLPSGEILLVGGFDSSSNPTHTAELVDPGASDQIMTPGAMNHARAGHTATLLASGMVLVAGGHETIGATPELANAVSASAELYDSVTKSFRSNSGGVMTEPRSMHGATLLPSGRVLLSGGVDEKNTALVSSEEYDPETQRFEPVGPMNQGRYGHASLLLPSGNVLISGGKNSDGSLTTLELYHPSSRTFEPASLSYQGIASAVLANGGVLLASNGGVAHVFGDALAEVFGEGVPNPVAVVPVANGDVLLGGTAHIEMFSPLAPNSRRTVSTRSLFAAVRHSSGGMVGVAGGVFRFDPRPRGVVLPTITAAPGTMSSGQTITLRGSRFSTATAAGTLFSTPDPSHLPLVAFVPAASSGGPIVGHTRSWSDTELTWQVPKTVFRGPGFLHVYVEGVWSNGHYIVLNGLPSGSCSHDGECSSNHCVDGVCCDKSCSGGCESCLAANQEVGAVDGICGPIAYEGKPRFGCEHDESNVCSPTGTCDGVGNCTLPPQRSECAQSCSSHGDCAEGNRCNFEGRCVPLTSLDDAPDTGACSVRSDRSARTTGANGSAMWVGLIPLALAAMRTRRRTRYLN